MLQSQLLPSVETRRSWVVATVVLIVMAVAFGAPWITVVALKNIAAEVNGERSIPAFAGALVCVGAGLGGIVMGRVAERVGVRWTVIGGALMIAAGLALSTFGPSLPLYVGHGLFIGVHLKYGEFGRHGSGAHVICPADRVPRPTARPDPGRLHGSG